MSVVERLKEAFRRHQAKVRAYREKLEEERQDNEAIAEGSISPSNAMPIDRLICPKAISGAKLPR
jgi:hypothetical protein